MTWFLRNWDQVAVALGEHLLIAAQAVDLSGIDLATMGRGARAAYDAVRAGVPMLDGDRPLGPDIETVERALRDGRLDLAPPRR